MEDAGAACTPTHPTTPHPQSCASFRTIQLATIRTKRSMSALKGCGAPHHVDDLRGLEEEAAHLGREC